MSTAAEQAVSVHELPMTVFWPLGGTSTVADSSSSENLTFTAISLLVGFLTKTRMTEFWSRKNVPE